MAHQVNANGEDSAVPAAGAAIVALLNSGPYAVFDDRLDDPECAADLLRSMHLDANALTTPEAREDLRGVRDVLADLVTDESAQHDDARWGGLSALLSATEWGLRFAPDGATLQQVKGDPVIGRVAVCVAELLNAGTWSRVRLCANEECRVAFYDTTRSRTRRWHSYETCGNRTNVAAHRARRSQELDHADMQH